MAEFAIKKGLGTAYTNPRKPIEVWHIVKDGRTVASCDSRGAAISHILSRYGRDAARQAIKNERGF